MIKQHAKNYDTYSQDIKAAERAGHSYFFNFAANDHIKYTYTCDTYEECYMIVQRIRFSDPEITRYAWARREKLRADRFAWYYDYEIPIGTFYAEEDLETCLTAMIP